MKVIIQNLHKEKHLASDLATKYDHPDIMLLQEINLYSEDVAINDDDCRYPYDCAHNTSKFGYGTAIYAKKNPTTATSTATNGAAAAATTTVNTGQTRESRTLSNIRYVDSPHAETGGFIYKKTVIATYNYTSKNADGGGETRNQIELISFHGYNGQPLKSVTKLVDHVKAVLEEVRVKNRNPNKSNNNKQQSATNIPAIFGGDFNTWTRRHINAVSDVLRDAGFTLLYSWPYPGRRAPLDHLFVRGDIITNNVNKSDITVFSNASDHNGIVFEIQNI